MSTRPWISLNLVLLFSCHLLINKYFWNTSYWPDTVLRVWEIRVKTTKSLLSWRPGSSDKKRQQKNEQGWLDSECRRRDNSDGVKEVIPEEVISEQTPMMKTQLSVWKSGTFLSSQDYKMAAVASSITPPHNFQSSSGALSLQRFPFTRRKEIFHKPQHTSFPASLARSRSPISTPQQVTGKRDCD